MATVRADKLIEMWRLAFESTSPVGLTKPGILPEGISAGKMQEKRVRFRGANESSVYRGVLYPRIARDDWQELIDSIMGVDAMELDGLLAKFFKRGSREWHDFLASRVVMRSRTPGGPDKYSVGMNPVPSQPVPSEVTAAGQATSAKKVTYYLSQLLADTSLQTKYGFSAKFRQDMAVVAVTRPADAAATFRDVVQQMRPDLLVKVDVGVYARTSSHSRRVIWGVASRYSQPSASIESEVIGKHILMYGPLGPRDWFVKGPMEFAESVSDAYKIMSYSGLQSTVTMFGLELQRLQIEVYDGQRWIVPEVQAHMCTSDVELPTASSDETLDIMTPTAHETFGRLQRNIRPLMGDGMVVASSVQVGTSRALVNEHVLKSGTRVTSAGRSLVGTIPVGHDLWSFSSGSGYEPWGFRAPNVGEMVAIAYSTGTSVALSPPMRVDSCDGAQVYTKRRPEIVAGMSGGALVALSDMSLLGVHSGGTRVMLLSSCFTSTMQVDLQDSVDAALGQNAKRSNAEALALQLKARGLAKPFSTSVRRLVPLYDPDFKHFVGNAIAADSVLYTVCMPGRYLSEQGDVLRFERAHGFFSQCDATDMVVVEALPRVRTANLQESVVLVSADAKGPYVSAETSVRHVSPGGRNFMLNMNSNLGVNMLSGIVVAVQDSAVVGCYVRNCATPEYGNVALCATFPVVERERESDAVGLARVFPMLHPGAWPTEQLSTGLRHTSLTNGIDVEDRSFQGFAMIGDSVLRTSLYKNLEEAAVLPSQWNAYHQALQSNKKMASLCWETGLHALVHMQSGIAPPPGSKVYADLLESVVYLVHEYENSDVYQQFVSMLGLVPRPHEFVTPDHDYTKLMRRPSEFALQQGGTDAVSPVD